MDCYHMDNLSSGNIRSGYSDNNCMDSCNSESMGNMDTHFHIRIRSQGNSNIPDSKGNSDSTDTGNNHRDSSNSSPAE